MPQTSRSPSPPTKRLLQELKDHNSEPFPFLQHLGPRSESQLFEWEAVMRGPGGTAYEGIPNISATIFPVRLTARAEQSTA